MVDRAFLHAPGMEHRPSLDTGSPPGVIIRSVLGEEIDRVDGVWDLVNADLRHRQWAHADLSGLSLDGANCSGINLFGARLVKSSFCRCSLVGAELSFSNATGAEFSQAKLDNCSIYRSETRLARFHGAIITETRRHTRCQSRECVNL